MNALAGPNGPNFGHQVSGVHIIREPTDYHYGERQYSAEDFAGHHWGFSQSIADVDPRDWGGTPGQLWTFASAGPRTLVKSREVRKGLLISNANVSVSSRITRHSSTTGSGKVADERGTVSSPRREKVKFTLRIAQQL